MYNVLNMENLLGAPFRISRAADMTAAMSTPSVIGRKIAAATGANAVCSMSAVRNLSKRNSGAERGAYH